MFPFNFPEIDIATLVAIVAVVFTFPLQLVLCFKAKKLLVRLIPLTFCIFLTILFSVFSAYSGGWDGIGYLFFAILFAFLTFVCGLGWGLWAVARKKHNKNT